jgi:hypothetical protein
MNIVELVESIAKHNRDLGNYIWWNPEQGFHMMRDRVSKNNEVVKLNKLDLLDAFTLTVQADYGSLGIFLIATPKERK